MQRGHRAGLRALSGLLFAAVALAVIVLHHPVPAEAESFEVSITSGVAPATLSVAIGDTVTWRNSDSARHRIRSRTGPVEFDSGNLEPGQTFSVHFTAAGTYDYADERNPDRAEYRGAIIVGAPPAGGTVGGAPGSPAPSTATVGMAGRAFGPSVVTIAAGGSVVFRNNDGDEHTATAHDRTFDSRTLAPGTEFSRTFATPGRFPFFCSIHPDMTGEVIVTDAAGATPVPTPTPTATPVPNRSTTAPTAPGTTPASIVDFDFAPRSLTIQAGAIVTWTNDGVAPHTVTATDAAFDSDWLATGEQFSRTFSTPGRFPFFCSIHPNMTGEVIVTDAAGAAPAPTPAASQTSSGSAPASSRAARAATAESVTSALGDLSFEPEEVALVAGQTLIWVNGGVAPHTVTARDGSFGSDLLASGDQFSRVFSEPGRYDLYCTIHPSMVQTVVVTERLAGPEAAEAPAVEASGTAIDAAKNGPSGGPSVLLVTIVLLAVAAAGMALGFVLRSLEPTRKPPQSGA